MTDLNLLDRVRAAVRDAQRDGRPAPGRPALIRLTGATDHAVKKALHIVASEDAQPATSQPIPHHSSGPGALYGPGAAGDPVLVENAAIWFDLGNRDVR